MSLYSLGETLDVIFHLMVKNNLILYLHTHPFEKSTSNPTWYKENDNCDYHCVNTKHHNHEVHEAQGLHIGCNRMQGDHCQSYYRKFIRCHLENILKKTQTQIY